MTCLQISIDHRLRKIIKGFGPITSPSQALGNHVKLLHEFGGRLIYDGDASKKAVSVLNMDFTLQLARPESTGGVLVLLLHPDKSQLFERGYLAEAEKCATIKAVLELISVVNDGCLTKDAVSVFDSLPFLTEDYNESETHQKAQETFVAMVKAKKPEVVISCFKTETNLKEIELLSKMKVGGTFNPLRVPITAEHTTTRVNAIHPSYAMNRVPTESCFRQLLTLEFAHGFGMWRGTWKEERWMQDLREHCQRTSLQYYNYEPSEQRHNGRLCQVMEKIDTIIRRSDFFRTRAFLTPIHILTQMEKTNLAWLFCDAGLILKDLVARSWDLEYNLFNLVHDWCSATSLTDLTLNSSSDRGYFEHDQLVLRQSTHHQTLVRPLQEHFFAFLRQLNLSMIPISPETGVYRQDIEIQADAFHHFSSRLEDFLAGLSDLADSREVDAVAESVERMNVGAA